MISLPKSFLIELVDPIIRTYQGVKTTSLTDDTDVTIPLLDSAYPNLISRRDQIVANFTTESERFVQALQKGLYHLEKVDRIDEQLAFYLFESYGFPFELTQELAQERGTQLDAVKFTQLRKEHADASRTASAGKFKGGLQDSSETTIKFHTATHLLHAALRQVLGAHVQQQGSNITTDRLRFDFSHPEPMSDQQKSEVIKLVNGWIAADLPVTRQVMTKELALNQGALAFFGQKYPAEVSVYTIGNDPDQDWISKELCGGPHVERTGTIGPLQLLKEQSVSAGVRRVYLQFVH